MADLFTGRPSLFLRLVTNRQLPREVGEGLVGVGHAVGLLASVHGLAFLAVGGEQLVGETLRHRAAALVTAGGEQPAEGERLLALAVDLHGHLVVGATDAAAAHFYERLDVVDGGLAKL